MLIAFLIIGILSLWAVHTGKRYAQVDWGKPKLNWIDGLVRRLCHRVHHLAADTHIPLPESGPAIVVANHVSGLDPFLLIAACRRPLRFLIAREEYERPILNWLFKASGCIPVDRAGRPEKALRQALRALEAGEVIGIFPHGKIHLDHEPDVRIKGGVVRLAAWSGAPVFPVRIEGVKAQGQVALAPFIPGHVTLTTKPVIHCEVTEIKACLTQVQHAISA